MKHPMQKVRIDEHGTVRFVENKAVQELLNKYPGGLNALCVAVDGENTSEDWAQLCQMIGYSVGGFSELSCSTQKMVNKAERRAAVALALRGSAGDVKR